MRAIYVADSEGKVASAGVTVAKTIFGIKADAGHAIDLLALAVTLDGTVASDKAVLVELCYCTWASNPPGTNSTAVTVDQEAGPRIAETFSAGRDWSTEPTVITVLRPMDWDPYKFAYVEKFDYGETPDSAAGEGFAVRLTVPTGGGTVNARTWAKWARV